MTPQPQPTYTVAAVARRIGVAPATLRTWDRRYGVGPSEHCAGAHRRYSDDDVARLERMRQFVISGVPPAEAAKLACLPAETDGLATVTQLRPSARERAVPENPGRAGGGQVVALPGAPPAVRGLARAAQTLDTHACIAIIGDSLQARGVERTWDELVAPVLIALGDRWRDTGRGVEMEHALSAAVQEALTLEIARLEDPVNSRCVLLACAPDELHSLPLWALSAALAERGIAARILGARLPWDSLVQSVHRTGPAAIFLWSQVPTTGDYEGLAAMPAFRPAVRVIVGGPGWREEPPATVCRVLSLPEAVEEIARALGE